MESNSLLQELLGKPLKFIEWTSDGNFELNEETSNLLHQLDTPVVVIGIAGIYRSGKSYLMNLLAGKTSGFELGNTVESLTKGIWIWCHPHPTLPNTTLILMDTEGLEDVSTGDDNRDMQIIVMTLLLCSTFIYNTTGRLDNNLIKQLGFVSELSNHIQISRASPVDDGNSEYANDTDFDFYLPTLIIMVRDFVLKLEIDKKPVSANEYFEKCLTLKESVEAKNNRKVADFNEPRIKIRKYFPESKRHCLVLPQPVNNFNENTLSRLEYLSKDEMNQEFLEKCAEYKEFILDISQRKSFGQLDKVNGRMFVDMADVYVKALLSGEIPCIQSALKLTAIQENKRVLDSCLQNYNTKINQLDFPLTQEELSNAHNLIVDELTREFRQKIIFDESQEFLNEFKDSVMTAFNHAVELNEKSSQVKCEKILEDLNTTINKKMIDKNYLCPGGYDTYMTDLKELKMKYKSIDRKGIKSEKVLHQFLKAKEAEINIVIEVDKEMTANKVKEEGEKRLREEIELREKALREEVELAKKREETLQQTMKESQKAMADEMNKRLDSERVKFEQLMKDREASHQKMSEELKRQVDSLRGQIGSGGSRTEFIPCSVM